MKIEQICENTIIEHSSKYNTLKERWVDFVARYESKIREGSITDETTSRSPIGAFFSLVENAIPRLLSRRPRYRYLATKGKVEQSVEVYDDLARYQWDLANAQERIKTIVRWGLTCGLAGWKISWKEEKRLRKRKGKELAGIQITDSSKLGKLALASLKKLGLGKDIKLDEEDTIAGYEITPIKPMDLVWSVEAEEVEDARVFGYKVQTTVREVKAQGFDVNKILSSRRDSDYWKKRIEDDDVTIRQANKDIEEENVELYELYTRILNEKGYYEYKVVYEVVTSGEGDSTNVIHLKTIDNPYDEQFRPMGVFRPTKKLSKMYGTGVIEPSRGVIDAEEDLMNMSLEALWTNISSPIEYNPQNLIKPGEIEYKPRTLIPVRQLGASVNVMETPRLDSGAFTNMAQYLTKTKQNISGITDFQTGADQVKGAKTLGEIQIKTEESNARLKMMLEQLEIEVLQPIGKMALLLNKQYLPEKQVISIVGGKGLPKEQKVQMKDLDPIKDVVVVGGSSQMVMQQTELQKWSLLLNQANQELATPNPVPVNKEEIWKRLLEEGLMIKDIETFLPSVEEREEGEVGDEMAQLEDAKAENANPSTARVLPTDNTTVHMRLHKAEIEARQREIEQGEPDERLLEELQILTAHYNDHARIEGGAVPNEITEQDDNRPIPQQ